MRVGITGHQDRPGIDWAWARHEIGNQLRTIAPIETAYSSLAAGSDQIFATVCLELGIPITAVIPMDGYERFFHGDDLYSYRRLLAASTVVVLSGPEDEEAAFFNAGKYIADRSDLLIAIWDGKPAAGRGGTADIVAIVHDTGRAYIHLNPIDRTISCSFKETGQNG